MSVRKRLFSFALGLLSCILFSVSHSYAVKVEPIVNARLLGGQYFFENQESNLSGNIGMTVAPAVTFNKKWSLIPRLSASWRGTKSVRDLVGGGTLFQQTQDHSVAVKGIYTPNEHWFLKSGGGYRIQLLRETNDEKWGKGLFDFQKPSANLEAERIVSKETSLRLGYDFYVIDFRNFSSLESQQRDLGRENASAKTLNTANHAAYLGAKFGFPFFKQQRVKVETAYYFTLRNFSEQTVVLLTGDLSSDLRRDKSHVFTSNFALPFFFTESFKLLAEIKANLNILSSNQHNYDAKKTRFNSNYYAYRDIVTGTNLNFLVGSKPLILSPGFSYARRNYADRPLQDVIGNYGTDTIHTNEYYLNFSAVYPVNKNIKVQATASRGWSRSNMKYEKTYRYNYVTFTYLMGIVYEY